MPSLEPEPNIAGISRLCFIHHWKFSNFLSAEFVMQVTLPLALQPSLSFPACQVQVDSVYRLQPLCSLACYTVQRGLRAGLLLRFRRGKSHLRRNGF
jgi:hypothetical protein